MGVVSVSVCLRECVCVSVWEGRRATLLKKEEEEEEEVRSEREKKRGGKIEDRRSKAFTGKTHCEMLASQQGGLNTLLFD